MSRPLVSMPVGDAAARASVLRRLELAVLRRLDGRASGDHATRTLGPGGDRAAARPYEPGDDARLVDWNLTARLGQVHVRQTEADRELETWVVADRSASLDFGTADREKRDVVLGAAAAFGMLTVRGGNRFGVLLAGTDRLVQLPARQGRTAMLAALAAIHDTPRWDAPPAAGADLSAGCRRLLTTQPRRSQVVVVSDFLDDAGWEEPLHALATRHQVVACHVTDPRELALPAVGMLAVVDTETGRQRYVQTGSARLRSRYAAAAADRQRSISRRIHATGSTYLHLSTDRDWLTDTIDFAGRMRRMRGVRR